MNFFFGNICSSLDLQIFINEGFWREEMDRYCFRLDGFDLNGPLGFKKAQ